jgi:hypothetical protein
VLKGRTYESLSKQSGLSIASLKRHFHQHFDTLPPEIVLPLPQLSHQYLIYDALWFGRKFCCLAYRIYPDPLIIHHSIRKSERSTQIKNDLESIVERGYQIDGVVSDGAKGFIGATAQVFPHKPHQICLAHMHRQATRGLGRRPKEYQLQRLKSLADHVWKIESKEALKWWLQELNTWGKLNRSYLQEYTHDSKSGRWWYTHRNARSTLSKLIKASETSFKFLDQPLMPKTTNGMEGTFSNLRIKWQIHKGLKQERWENFVGWFIYLRNKNILAGRKNNTV